MTDKPTLQELLEVQDFYDLPSPALVEKIGMLLKRLPPLLLLIRRRLNWYLAAVQPWGVRIG